MKYATVCVVLLFSLLSSTACQSQSTDGQKVETLEGEAFLDSLEGAPDAYLIDCRTSAERATGVIAGAIGMDYSSPAFRQNLDTLDRARPVFVYCQRGGRSAKAAAILDEMGFSRVVDLKGGYGGLSVE